jgi:hypothetical protein
MVATAMHVHSLRPFGFAHLRKQTLNGEGTQANLREQWIEVGEYMSRGPCLQSISG